EHDDAVAMGADQVSRMLPANRTGYHLEELMLQRDDAPFLIVPLPDEAPEVVDVHHQKPVRHREVITKVSRATLDVGLVAEGAIEQVIDQFAADPVFGLGDFALLDHLECYHRRSVLDRHHGEL